MVVVERGFLGGGSGLQALEIEENDYSITKANVEEFKQSVGLVYTSKY